MTTLLTWLGLTGCASDSLGSESTGTQLVADQRYQVVFSEPVTPRDFEGVLEQAKEGGYWVRLGHEPEVRYYHGSSMCNTCEYSQEGEFFRGSRAYFDPVEFTFAIYMDSEEAETTLLGSSGVIEAFFEPHRDMLSQDAVLLVMEALADLGDQGSYAIPAIAFRGLPKERLLY